MFNRTGVSPPSGSIPQRATAAVPTLLCLRVCHDRIASLTRPPLPANEAVSIGCHGQERMHSQRKVLGTTVVALTLAISLAIGCSDAQAQTSRKAAASEKSAGPEVSWHDCQKAGSDVTPAIDAARRLLERFWLASGDTFFAAYTMPGEKRNPFDLSPREADSGPRDGFVEARPPRCVYHTTDAPGPAHHVRFVSPFYRFHEDGQGWSPPLRKGLMLEIVATQSGGEWQAAAAPSELTILLPEQKQRRPEEAKLPAAAAWAEPIPGCSKRQKWNGVDCVSRKR
jgi:hypothetical protein